MPEFTLRYLIDPAFVEPTPGTRTPATGVFVPLIREHDEYRVALSRTADLPAYRVLPDTVCLDLYAYELLERMRERLVRRSELEHDPGLPALETWVMPLWPESLYATAGCPVHAGREIAACYPRPDRVEVRVREKTTTEDAVRRNLGRLPCDAGAYQDDLTRAARSRGWTVIQEGTAENGGGS